MKHFYFKSLFATMLLCCTLGANAAAIASSSSTPVVSASFGDGNTMYINIANPDYPFTAAQFDIELEGGISVATDGEYYDVFLGSRTSSRNHSEPECGYKSDGSLRVVIISLSNKLFTGTEGDIATVTLDATGAADGEYKYKIKNVILSDPNSVIEQPADIEGSFFVKNGVISEEMADAGNEENYLDIETISINPGEEVEVPILLYYTHEDGITASEFDILLPDGITVKTDKKGRPIVSDGDMIDEHTTTKSYSGNKLKVKSLSMDLYTYYGDSGDVLYTITLIADENLTDCELTLDLVNMELTAADDALTAIKPADRQIKIIVGEGDTTGINGVASEGAASDEAIYDLTGRKVTEMVKGGIYIKGGKKIFVK